MAIITCDNCGKENVPGAHHGTDYERGHVGDVSQCYVCAGDEFDPYCEMEEAAAKVVPIQPYLDERDMQERIEWANVEAGWYFNKATAPQKAKFDLAMNVARGCVGPVWERKREAARKEWAESTKDASALFDRTVEWFISHGELSDELDVLWTDLFNREIVRLALQAAE